MSRMKPRSIDEILKKLGNPMFVLYGKDKEEDVAEKRKRGSRQNRSSNRNRALAVRYGMRESYNARPRKDLN
jgi:hypothetical protein